MVLTRDAGPLSGALVGDRTGPRRRLGLQLLDFNPSLLAARAGELSRQTTHSPKSRHESPSGLSASFHGIRADAAVPGSFTLSFATRCDTTPPVAPAVRLTSELLTCGPKTR